MSIETTIGTSGSGNQVSDKAGDGTASPASSRGGIIRYTQTHRAPVSAAILKQNKVIAGFDPCPFVDVYKVLRTKILLRMRERDWNAIAIVGASPGSGGTLTSVNLAISMAWEANQTVLLVDANLRSPGVARCMGIDAQRGLADYLLDNVPLDQLLINPQGIDRFVILPGARPLADSSEMLSSPRMVELVEELKCRYPSRIVLFDLPHIATSDSMAFAPYVDAVLLVIEEGRTSEEQLRQALVHLGSTPVLGSVLNKAE